MLNFCAPKFFVHFQTFFQAYLPTILKMYFFVYAMVGINFYKLIRDSNARSHTTELVCILWVTE